MGSSNKFFFPQNAHNILYVHNFQDNGLNFYSVLDIFYVFIYLLDLYTFLTKGHLSQTKKKQVLRPSFINMVH